MSNQLIEVNEEGFFVIDHPTSTAELISVVRAIVEDFVAGEKEDGVPLFDTVASLDGLVDEIKDYADKLAKRAGELYSLSAMI